MKHSARRLFFAFSLVFITSPFATAGMINDAPIDPWRISTPMELLNQTAQNINATWSASIPALQGGIFNLLQEDMTTAFRFTPQNKKKSFFTNTFQDTSHLETLSLNEKFNKNFPPEAIGNGQQAVASATAPVPEPATLLLFGTGLLGLAGLTRRRSTH